MTLPTPHAARLAATGPVVQAVPPPAESSEPVDDGVALRKDGPAKPPPSHAGAGRSGVANAAGPESTAKDLFASANDARRNGNTSEAVLLYRELARRFQGTREEVTSRVALGRLLLDRLGDPAGALPLFDSYLAGNPNGTLAEEAQAGRALCFKNLGRSLEEREAWRQLLLRFPNSVHAARARARIDSLP